MSFDRLDIANRIINIHEYANRHGAALALHQSFRGMSKYDQANVLDNAMDALDERIETRYADTLLSNNPEVA